VLAGSLWRVSGAVRLLQGLLFFGLLGLSSYLRKP